MHPKQSYRYHYKRKRAPQVFQTTIMVWNDKNIVVKGLAQGNYKNRMLKNADTPFGLWVANSPVKDGSITYGPIFFSLEPIWGEALWAQKESDGPIQGTRNYGAGKIGLHGGGTYVPDPLSSNQLLSTTNGCMRFTNADITRLGELVQQIQSTGEPVFALTGDKEYFETFIPFLFNMREQFGFSDSDVQDMKDFYRVIIGKNLEDQ